MNPQDNISQPSEQEVAKLVSVSPNRAQVRKPVMLRGPDGRITGTQRRTQEQIVEDFWKRVAKGSPDECWEWQRARNERHAGRDYGIMWVNGKKWKTHVFSYVLHFGPVNGLWVLHRCDNPPCCNPNHLFLGTCKDNVHDMISKGRAVRERGEDRYNARLTEDDIREIRRRCVRWDKLNSQTALAKEFGVYHTMIHAIITGRRWKHVT